MNRICSLCALLLLASPSAAAAQQEPSLLGGATSLREAHGDWQVTCVIQTLSDSKKVKRCVLSQEQFRAETRERALAIELRPEGDGIAGMLVLPFGLALQAGVSYQIDEGEKGAPQPYRTCLPAGCIVDVDLGAATLSALQSGTALKVVDGGQAMTLSISLAGFSSAYDRVAALLP